MEQNTIEQKYKSSLRKLKQKKTQMSRILQAVKEVAVTVIPFIATKEEYRGMKL